MDLKNQLDGYYEELNDVFRERDGILAFLVEAEAKLPEYAFRERRECANRRLDILKTPIRILVRTIDRIGIRLYGALPPTGGL